MSDFATYRAVTPRALGSRWMTIGLMLVLCVSLAACKKQAKVQQIQGAWVVDEVKTLALVSDAERDALERTLRVTRFGLALNKDNSVDAHVVAYLPLDGEVKKITDSTYGTYRVIDVTGETFTLELRASKEGDLVHIDPVTIQIKVLDDAHMQFIPQAQGQGEEGIAIRDQLVLKRVDYSSFPTVLIDPSAAPSLQDFKDRKKSDD